MSSSRSIVKLGRHVAEELAQVERREHALLAARGGVARRVVAGPSLLRRARRAVPILALAAAVLGAAALVVQRALPVGYTVGEAHRPGVVGEWIRADSASIPIAFSDGARLVLAARAQARVSRLTPAGADVVLESGRAHVEIVPGAGARYEVRAGPFAVLVVGTRFDIEWSPERDELSVELSEGSVQVSGCALRSPHQLSAGEHLLASCEKPHLEVRKLGERVEARTAESSAPAQATSAPVPASAPSSARGPASAALPRSAAVTPVAKAASNWVALAKDGRFAGAYEAAAASGIQTRLDSISGGELSLFGDAARLSGHFEHARRAYTVLRARFPGTGHAASAAFSLARLSLDRGDAAAGARLLETYLAEAPRGDLASSAMGRLMELHAKAGRTSEARALADRYLKRYPNGPHARAAARIRE